MFYGVLKYDKNQGYRTGLLTVLDKAATELGGGYWRLVDAFLF